MTARTIIRLAQMRHNPPIPTPVFTERPISIRGTTIVRGNPTPLSPPGRYPRSLVQTTEISATAESLGIDERTYRALTHTWR